MGAVRTPRGKIRGSCHAVYGHSKTGVRLSENGRKGVVRGDPHNGGYGERGHAVRRYHRRKNGCEIPACRLRTFAEYGDLRRGTHARYPQKIDGVRGNTLKTLIPGLDAMNVLLNIASDVGINAGTELMDDRLNMQSIKEVVSDIKKSRNNNKLIDTALDSLNYYSCNFSSL